MSAYSELLKDPRWQKKRLEIFERDSWSCSICGDNKSTLNVHHKFYSKGKKPWEYQDNALITLCPSCHETWHVCSPEIEKQLLEALLSSVSSFVDLEELCHVVADLNENFHRLIHLINLSISCSESGEIDKQILQIIGSARQEEMEEA